PAENAPPCAPHRMGDQLAVAPREVRGCRHSAKIGLALRRGERRAGRLAIGERDPIWRHDLVHEPHVFGAGLMAEPPRAGVDEDRNLVLEQPEGRGASAIKDLSDALNLEEMIAGSERTELI